MKTRKSVTFVVVVIITATLLIIPSIAASSITDLAGYNITFKNLISYPSDYQSYYTFSIDYTLSNNGVTTEYNNFDLRQDTDNPNQFYINYLYLYNGSIVRSTRAYNSASGWTDDSYRSIKITGGANSDSTILLNFVNYNTQNAYPDYQAVDDPYDAIFGQIENAQPSINSLEALYSQADTLLQTVNLIAFGKLAQPIKPFIDYFGVPIIMYGIAITVLVFVKRSHFHVDDSPEPSIKP